MASGNVARRSGHQALQVLSPLPVACAKLGVGGCEAVSSAGWMAELRWDDSTYSVMSTPDSIPWLASQAPADQGCIIRSGSDSWESLGHMDPIVLSDRDLNLTYFMQKTQNSFNLFSYFVHNNYVSEFLKLVIILFTGHQPTAYGDGVGVWVDMCPPQRNTLLEGLENRAFVLVPASLLL